MKNKEKYHDEIFEIALNHDRVAITKDGKPTNCSATHCQECLCSNGACETLFEEWCNSEYKEPCEFKEGELVEVRQKLCEFLYSGWSVRNFSHKSDGLYYCYADNNKDSIYAWDECRKYGTLGGLNNDKERNFKEEMKSLVKLGFLKLGDLFVHNFNTYKVGHADGFGYVYCTNVITHKVTRICLDCEVEKLEKRTENE